MLSLVVGRIGAVPQGIDRVPDRAPGEGTALLMPIGDGLAMRDGVGMDFAGSLTRRTERPRCEIATALEMGLLVIAGSVDAKARGIALHVSESREEAERVIERLKG
jgi:hypothetical protein